MRRIYFVATTAVESRENGPGFLNCGMQFTSITLDHDTEFFFLRGRRSLPDGNVGCLRYSKYQTSKHETVSEFRIQRQQLEVTVTALEYDFQESKSVKKKKIRYRVIIEMTERGSSLGSPFSHNLNLGQKATCTHRSGFGSTNNKGDQ